MSEIANTFANDPPDQSINQPVSRALRIVSIDVLRGFALLGILIVNIQVFAMIGAAYSNPAAYGDLEGANYWTWWLTHVFFDAKMMSIFSMLFGAGIVLMYHRTQQKTGKSAGLHYRRMLWLSLFGLAHAHLIWFGDILFSYGICGMVVYWAKKWKPATLFIVGIAMVTIPCFINVGLDRLVATGGQEFQAEMQADWQPDVSRIQLEVEAYRGSWIQQMEHRVPLALTFETLLLAIWVFWRAGGLMLIGMAFFKIGLLDAKKSTGFYFVGTAAGLLVGMPLILYGVRQNFAASWTQDYSMFIGSQFNYCGSLFVSFAYVCMIMLICKWDILRLLRTSLQAVGQMALTNYLMQSIVCTLIFYGHGFGYFAYLSRVQQLGVVISICLLQMIVSPIWLNYFRFGPFEWLWRSLSYWHWQPFFRTRDPGTDGIMA